MILSTFLELSIPMVKQGMRNLIPLVVFRLKIILWVFFCGAGNRITFIFTILSAVIYVHNLQLDTVDRLFTKKNTAYYSNTNQNV